VPTISLFFNIKILMFWNDHAPPHFHAAFVGEDEDTIINIRTLEILAKGSLKRRALGLVLDWAELHRDELLVNWELARDGKPLNQIEPLE
jgi:Domain of unknown function (DUF4160)